MPRTTPHASPMPAHLHDGYRRFRNDRFRQEADRYRKLAEAQRPPTMIIGCADSRVDPATIFAAAPGELFVVRNVAALVPPFEETGTYHGTSAALEFAVTGLHVREIVVLGHGLCGGVAASLQAADNEPIGKFIKPWVELLSQDRDAMLARIDPSHSELRQQTLERLGVQRSIANLMTFPFVAEAIAAGALSLHGAWFSIAKGELHWLQPGADVFEPVSP